MYWIRDIDVYAGQKKFESLGENALHIEFEINFSDGEEPDTSEVIIYNLSDDSIEAIKRDGYCYVDAGYREMRNKANILTGEIEDVETEWQGMDKITTIKISDGGKSWRTTMHNQTYAEGTTATQVLTDLANKLGYEIVAIKPVQEIVYKLGLTLTKSASKSLQQIVHDTKSKMFINKDRIVIRGMKEGYQTGFVLNQDSGLVGTPSLIKDESGDKADDRDREKSKKKKEETAKRWKVISLLNPRLETDSIIRVESKTINGDFRVRNGKHTKDFNTEMEVEEV